MTELDHALAQGAVDVRGRLALLLENAERDPALAESTDELAASGAADLLAELLAPAPDLTATSFLVRLSSGDDAAEFTSPIEAWEEFRTSPPGTELVSVADDVRRKVAVLEPDGDLCFVRIGEDALTGPAAEDTLTAWREFAAEQQAKDKKPGRVAEFVARLREGDRWSWAYLVLGLVAFAMSFVLIRSTLDDSFITWRYGETLIQSGRWNWNADGPLVEAYTNPLYAIASIVPALLGISAELFFKLVSLGIVAGYVVVVRQFGLPKRQEFLLLAVALASPVFFLQLYHGLETASFALLIGWLFALVHRTGQLGTTGFLVAGAVALSRPEGIVFTASAIGLVLLTDRSRATVKGAIAVLGGWAVYWLIRWIYFGKFFPNSFYQKSAVDRPFGMKVIDTAAALAPALGVAVLAALVCLVLYRRADDAPRPDRATLVRDLAPLLLAVLSAAVVLGLYKNSNLVMDPAHRYYWQLLFPVVLVALSRPLIGGDENGDPARSLGALLAVGVAMVTVLAWEPLDLKTAVVPLLVGVVVLAAVICGVALRVRGALGVATVGLALGIGFMSVSDMMSWTAYRYRLEYAHEALGAAIASVKLPPGAIAVGDAGVLPYEIRNRVIDVVGLASPEFTDGPTEPRHLDEANLKMAILGSGGPGLDQIWRSGPSSTVDFYARTHQFWSSTGAKFGEGYHLNYWISPDWAATGLPDVIAEVNRKSVTENGKPDAMIFLDNFWSFPFLR
nr:hypothetical protein [Kibdelosporangium sp. MJ126-NF4]CEL19063.1 hypothetical protein [Kibdelosporangium sp. MJ126-NF4]CTQ95135.1 hypothetical protein [Kibdelosporangium sp. MJ126-NF4]